jgi:hypothetical protein
MKTKPLTFLLSLTFMFFFGTSSIGEEKDLDQDAFICEGDWLNLQARSM